MNRRHLFQLVSASALVVALAACGSDGSSSSEPISTRPRKARLTSDRRTRRHAPAAGGFRPPHRPDDQILNYSELNGFTTMEYSFQQPPMC